MSEPAPKPLSDSEDSFRLLVAGVKDYGIFLLDPEGHILTWNEGAERINGWPAEHIIGQHFSVFYPREAVDRGWPQHELEVASREGRFEDEGWRVRKDGTQFWANVIITAVKDEQGRLRGFSKVTRDLTERKRFEDELKQKVEELAEASRQKDEFLAMLGHELRNPLAPIRNAAYILRLPGTDRATAEQMATLMEQQVTHMSRLVDDLLDVAHVQRGHVQLRREPVKLGEVINRAVESIRPQVEARGQAISTVLPNKQIRVDADPTRMEQMFLNLLGNATKYTPPGGSISLLVEAENSHVQIRVRDTGMGIAPDLLPHVFDLFKQGRQNIDRREGGLGIGLTLVRKIAELHGGTVTVTSEGAGRGSEFTVRLPVLPHVTGDVDPPKTNLPRGLIVEDVPETAQTLEILLRAWGYEPRIVHDGPSAVVAFRTYQPEVVLLDIGLPGISGYDVARMIRLEKVDGKRPLLVAVTGYGREDDRRKADESGFDFHMTKPLDPSSLQRLLFSARQQ